ncbi:MAG: tetratricopeptide repeat protein [Rhizomicrobium sp.]
MLGYPIGLKLMAAIALCAVALSPAGAAPPPDAVSAALHAGNASDAFALATKALDDKTLSPRARARVLIERGLAREMLGERDEALLDFTEALGSHALPPSEIALGLYDRGVTLDELSRTEDAIGDYSAAIRIEPNFPAALNNRANGFRRLGKLEEARRDYEASIAAGNPNREYPDFGLGQVAEASGDIRAARSYYRASLAANPNFGPAKDRMAALGAEPDAGDAPIVLRPPTQGIIHLRPPRAGHRSAPAAPDAQALPLRSALTEGAPGGAAGIVQLGAWRSQGEAAIAWSRIGRVAGSDLAGLTPQVIAADLPGRGRYYRLRADSGAKGAAALCGALRAKGLACIVVRD